MVDADEDPSSNDRLSFFCQGLIERDTFDSFQRTMKTRKFRPNVSPSIMG